MKLSKNVLILSEPRSGSHWFQSCLKGYYSLGEFFNVRNIESFFFAEGRAEPSPYTEIDLSAKETEIRLKQRMAVLSDIQKPYSIKVHTFQINEVLREWISTADAHVFLLKRRDRLQCLKSFLIANHLRKYSGPLEAQKIFVTEKNLLDSAQVLFQSEKDLQLSTKEPIVPVFYEDLAHTPENEWFKPSSSWMIHQRSAEKVQIENWGALLDLLAKDSRLKRHFLS